VAIVGALPRTEALARLRGCDLFVFTSRTETQGLVLAEALTCGLPAVAVAGPGVADSVRHGVDGIVVDAMPEAERAARLADAISALLAEPARRAALASRAAADAHRFAVDSRVAEIEAVYRAVGA
jgi:glycosyltransferase involved in cell wall biosynthesis